jgi:diguanylate cyclase (GGDEF)-like protein
MKDDQNTILLDLKTQYENETETSFNDSPTGLFNHGFFQISLEREIKRANRYGASFSLALIDIDSFSDLNRRQSHLHGDRTLKTLARITLENIRETDIAARYSSDVLSVMMINSDKDQAVAAMERIRQAFEEATGFWKPIPSL